MKTQNDIDNSVLILQEPKQINESYIKFIFFVFGVSSLSGWNAILTALDYLVKQYEGKDVIFFFPIPQFIATFLVGLFLPKIQQILSLQFRLAWSLLVVVFILVILPIIAQYHSKENDTGYYCSLFLIFFVGLFNSLQQNSAISIAGTLGGEFIGIFFVGTGASGTIICIFRFICLAAFPNNDQLGCIIYFCVAGAWNVISVILFFQFKKTSFYEKVNTKNNQVQIDVNTTQSAINPPYTDNMESSEGVSDRDSLMQADQNQLQNKNIFEIVIYINRLIFPIPLYFYVASFWQSNQTRWIREMGKVFLINILFAKGPPILLLSFNIGDLVGKYISNYRYTFNGTFLYLLVLFRFGFFILFIMIKTNTIIQLWFIILNMFLFAAINGFCTGGLMQLGPERVNDQIKGTVGFVQAFSLTLGILLGSFLALTLKNVN